MAALDNFQKAIQNWARDEVNLIAGGLDVIWESPNAPRPSLPYLGLNILSFEKTSTDQLTVPDINGFAKLVSNYYVNVNVNCYYDGNSQLISGIQILDSLRLSLGKQEVINHFTINKIGLVKELTNILNTTTIIATGYEQRASIDLQFGVATYLETETGLIKMVEGKGDIDHYGQNIEKTYST